MRLRLRHLAFLLLLPTPGSGEPEALSKVEQIRALTPDRARARLPVRIEGVVTYFDGNSGHAFIHDDTGSVFFRPGKTGTPGAVEARMGDKVEIKGITWAGEFSPSIAGASSGAEAAPVNLSVLGAGKMPEPVPVPFDQLKTGRWHDQFVSIRGTVRDFKAAAGGGPGHLSLVLSGPENRSIEAWGDHLELGRKEDWLNQEIQLHGIVAGGGDAMGRLEDAHLLIGDSSWVIRDDEASAASFDQPPLPLGNLRRYLPPEVRGRRVRIDGTVSLAAPGDGFFLTDGSQGTWIGTPQELDLEVGDVVSTTGYLSDKGLSDAIVKVLAKGSPPAARVARARELADEGMRGSLVSVEGILRSVDASPAGARIQIDGRDGTSATARGPGAAGGLEAGARVLLTGVADGGELLLRGPEDIVILSSAPWLTPARRSALLAGAGIALVAGLLWVVSLKQQVAKQTRLIEAQLVHRTLVEERQRMGRELHDSLEQYLAGLHLQLDTLRDRIADSPDSVRDLASGAARMLEHCRDEARRSVFELRSQTFQREGLAAALVQFAEEANPGGSPEVTLEVSGESRPLDPAVEFHLLRCAQESVANALKHAKAHEIHVALEYLPEETRLKVEDDGKGFDPAGPPPAGRPSFGLLHLKERADRIKGRLAIQSAPGRGTIVTVSIPA
ncbi:sensor histidine kinase [Luteolibacter marinus]|uniref:sensor histidine kinase n=1 Tax=Luteolibacter marinus TaxID=2776705 RepID=UPI001866BC62|nr:sensor histidine kinase [Luteolibacter marinus]